MGGRELLGLEGGQYRKNRDWVGDVGEGGRCYVCYVHNK